MTRPLDITKVMSRSADTATVGSAGMAMRSAACPTAMRPAVSEIPHSAAPFRRKGSSYHPDDVHFHYRIGDRLSIAAPGRGKPQG
jgi:hypothetical protein